MSSVTSCRKSKWRNQFLDTRNRSGRAGRRERIPRRLLQFPLPGRNLSCCSSICIERTRGVVSPSSQNNNSARHRIHKRVNSRCNGNFRSVIALLKIYSIIATFMPRIRANSRSIIKDRRDAEGNRHQNVKL